MQNKNVFTLENDLKWPKIQIETNQNVQQKQEEKN